jgi:carboxymethylenebutenolidase
MIRLREREEVSVDSLNQMQRYVGAEMIDEYQAGHLTRRVMLRRLIYICGSSAAAAALLTACGATATAIPPTAAPTTAAPTTVPATTAPAATTAAPTTAAPTTAAPTTAAATTAPATTAPAATTAASGTPASGATTAPPAPTPGAAKGPLTVAATDPDLMVMDVTFQSDTAVTGYLARPKADGTYPGVIVIHENRGLTDHIKDVARRLAKRGYVALAPDLVSRSGGTATAGFDRIPGIVSQAKPEDLVKDLNAGVSYLETQAFVKKDKFGVVGFCFGGTYTLRLAGANPKIAAAVPYYGSTPEPAADTVGKTNAAIMANYGGNDARVNGTIPSLEKVMKDAGKTLEVNVYEGANHAFNNDTGANFNEKAAVEAWTKTIAWFDKYIKA